jgi:rSAM/selenodomain-associated transferase 2
MKFSIIIPTLNEEPIIESALTRLQHQRPACEIIIADGGSTDATIDLAASYADQVISSPQGRALQMNAGASQANGDVLIFLHVDTVLPDKALELIKQSLSNTHPWGRFDIRLSGRHPMFRLIALMMNWRSRLTGIATGDQVIFVSNQAFNGVGQYPEISLMEDIALCKALNKISPPVCLGVKVISSSRRWECKGIFQTILLMWIIRLLYFLGADPDVLAQLYAKGRIWKR